MVADLEEEANNSECFLIALFFRTIDKLMHDMHLQVILNSIEAVLCGAMHVHMVDLVLEGSLAVEVSHFDAA